MPLPLLRLLKALGARITVNQNGVYYPLWSHDFEKRNAFLRELNSQAHHTFFQSEFARASFERWVGPVPASHSLLYNAVDRRFYSPDWSRKTDRSHLRVLLFQDFREINRELWDFHLKLIQGAPAGVEWVILGRAESSALEAKVRSEVGGRPVTWELNPSAERVAKILPSSDVAFHFVHNDVCPNKVLECLASGVYVICSSAGGSRELVARGGGEALPTEESYERRTFPETALVWAALERFSADPEAKRREAHAASAAFDLPPWVKAMTAPPGG
ncbi:MAG: glycosyltransferase [Bdellovibrionota bacterium]